MKTSLYLCIVNEILMDYKELAERQSWSLDKKIDHAMGTIENFYNRLDGKCYVSFSGGKDSTIVLWLARKMFPNIKGVFCNTGNEYPDIVKFVRTFDNIDWIKPKMNPKDVLAKYGFPLVSKSSSSIIRKSKSNPNGLTFKNYVESKESLFSIAKKWEFLIDEDFNVSEKCCDILKKEPLYKYTKEMGLHPILGTMASESKSREMKYLQQGGCNSFDKAKIQSMPLSIWGEQDVWDCIRRYNIPISDIYNKGAKRTGCMFCGYGCQFKDDNRLQLVHKLYPKWYETFMNYTNNGFTYREALRKMLSVNGLYLPDERPAELFCDEDFN